MRNKYKVLSLSHMNLSILVNLFTSALFFYSLHIVLVGHLLIYAPSPLTSICKVSDVTIILHMFCGSLPYDLRNIAHHVTHTTMLNSPVSDLSITLCSHFMHYRPKSLAPFRTVICIYIPQLVKISSTCHILFAWSNC